MRPSQTYEVPIARARARLLRLSDLARQSFLPLTPQSERQVAYVVIEAAALWASFTRATFLSCAMGARHHLHGRISTVYGFLTLAEACDRAVWIANPRYQGQSRKWTHRDEPTWGDARVVGRMFLKLAPNNLTDIQGALSVPTRVFEDLPTFRNYYAHKGEATADKARARALGYGLSPNLRPSQIMLTIPPGQPRTVLMDWLTDLDNVVASF